MRGNRRAFILTAGVVLTVTLAGAEPKKKTATFAPHERIAINGYFQAYPRDLPPGLAKRGSLPPGLARQLRERGELPPGLEKRIAPFPLSLEQRLGPPPAGLRRGCLDGRAVLYDPVSTMIVDSFVIEVHIGR